MMTDPADRTRSGYIAGLRMLADLLEAHPGIPHYEFGSISFAVGGTQDEAFEVIERAAAALTGAGVPFEYETNDHAHRIGFVLAGVVYHFSRMHDHQINAMHARTSYEDNVQVPVAVAP